MGDAKRFALGGLAWAGLVAVGLVACGGGGGGGGATGVTVNGGGSVTLLGNCPMFPAEAVFNTPIDDTSRFPAHASSAGWIAAIGSSVPFRADWWRSEDATDRTAYYGMPVNLVAGTSADTDWAHVLYDYTGSGASVGAGWPHESDCAVDDGAGGYAMTRGCSSVPAHQRRFPFPLANLKNEGGTCNDPDTCGDHHVLVVEQGACRLWEGFHTYKTAGQWRTLSSAAWDLNSLGLRPSSWTSGDAAGLPITPFLVKAAEANSGEIRHALRVTLRDSVIANQFVWPARHAAGSSAGSVPFGAVLRLKADFVIPAHWNTQAKAIATAAKRYGLYVADIGSDFYVQGEPNVQWNDTTFSQLRGITMANMEFVDLGAVTGDPRFSANSMAASWR